MSKKRNKKLNCVCENPPLNYLNYIICCIGVDETNGRFADVSIEKCIYCNRKRIHYLVEFESFTKSGRWYKGIVLENDLIKITPENSIKYIENLNWYIFGGSYFDSREKIGKGKVHVDL